MSTELEALRHEVGILQDREAIRRLQFTYGYLMDKALFSEIVDLFAHDAELRFLNGIFRGKEGARRLYGGRSGLNGPSYGVLFEHAISQDVVDVAPDRRSATGRFRCLLLAGVHDTNHDAPPSLPAQFWEGGIYENEYVNDGGVWKIRRFNYTLVYQARYEDGWARSPREPLVVAAYTKTFPEDPRGPDELRAEPPRWPEVVVAPFHYAHPVTGRPIEVGPPPTS